MKTRTFTDRESEFPSRRKITILQQNANEIIADISFHDNPYPGKEGTKVDAELLNEFQNEIVRAGENSDKAIDDSSSALSNANAAVTTANSANAKSEQAVETSVRAETKSDTAVSVANTASKNASDAVVTSNTALSNSNTAVSTANSASAEANQAKTTANTALSNSEQAVTTANEAKETAETALTKSQKAESDSAYAKSRADEVAANLADRGATIYVGGESKPSVSFDSDPQAQINSKLQKDFNVLPTCETLNDSDMFVVENNASDSPKKTLWSKIKSQLLNMAYPIGSVYMSVGATNPSTLFGGSWEQLKDRFLLGAGDTYALGAVGGEASHTLTIAEMPSHTHTQNSHNHTQDAHNHLISNQGCHGMHGNGNQRYSDGNTQSNGNAMYTQNAQPGIQGTVATNQNTGGGTSHNNMPPYLVVYMWKRIA